MATLTSNIKNIRNTGDTVGREHVKSGQPLYRRIQQEMRARIAQGEWPSGQSLPSRVQLCGEFGTTRVTLDKAIQELVREGLLRSAKGSGTFIAGPSRDGVGIAAPTLRTPQTLRIGVVLGRAVPGQDLEEPGPDNFYFGPIFHGIRDAVAGRAVEIVYAHHGQSEYDAFYRGGALDGVILITPLLDELPTLRALAEAGVPYVAVGISSHRPADASLPVVDTDNRQGAYDAVQHLLGLGHRRIAIVNLATSQANHHDRLEGYRRALDGMPVDPADLLLYPIHDSSHLDERIEAWFCQAQAADRLPTAIFASDYAMTLATLRVLRRAGLRVPEDVSLVGFDDPFSAEHMTPALSTVRQPVYRMGRRAAERLLDALQTGTAPKGAEILPTQLIVRYSAGPPCSHHSSP